MSSVVVDEKSVEERLIPSSEKYTPSIFGNAMTLFSIIFVFIISILLLWGLLSTILAISHFKQTADQGYPKYPESDTGSALDYGFWMRWAIGGYILALGLYLPTRWMMRTYGRQSLEITDAGIIISKFSIFRLLVFPFALTRRFPFFNFSTKNTVSWDGIVDISVKKSTSIFAVVWRGVDKIILYSMDKAISLETMTLRNRGDLTRKLTAFGDSLEERVIDFGYGAQLAVVWRRLKRSAVGMVGALLCIFFIGVSLFASSIILVNPINTIEAQLQQRTVLGFWNPNYFNIEDINEAPSGTHWLGTDRWGRDIFARLFFGALYSILIGVVATFVQTIIGAVVGATSGYVGGTTDQILQRITEVLIAMPQLPILLLISASFTPLFEIIAIEGAYYLVVFFFFALISWGFTARVVRSEVLALKNSEFIQAERVLGATHYRIITKHIMPNSLSTVIIFLTLGLASNITAVAALAFLGFGSQSTLVWGQDLAEAVYNQPTKYWWGPTYISLALFLLVLGFNLLGDAFRDALDPRLKN